MARGGSEKMMDIFDIENAIIEREGFCISCNTPFRFGNIGNYSHTGGIPIDDFDTPQWVYFTCQKCGYETSLWKIERRLGKVT